MENNTSSRNMGFRSSLKCFGIHCPFALIFTVGINFCKKKTENLTLCPLFLEVQHFENYLKEVVAKMNVDFPRNLTRMILD